MAAQDWLYILAKIEIPIIFPFGCKGGHFCGAENCAVCAPMPTKLLGHRWEGHKSFMKSGDVGLGHNLLPNPCTRVAHSRGRGMALAHQTQEAPLISQAY